MKRKLKLTKLTVVNLDHVKGGNINYCACPMTHPLQGAYNHDLNNTLVPCTADVPSADC